MEYELYHHGILGQKWGVRRTPEQLGHPRTGPKKKRKFSFFKKADTAKPKSAKTAPKTKKPESKEEYEARKQKALASGKASEILKFKGNLTNNEMQTALNRINLERQLANMSASERKSAFDRIDAYVKRAEQISKWVDSGSKIYSSYKKAIDLTNPNTNTERYKKSKELANKYLKNDFGSMNASDVQEMNTKLNQVVNIERIALNGGDQPKKDNK